jgi:prephenate dehydrogenase
MPQGNSATHVDNPDYPASRVLPGMMARLVTEDWHKMAAAANASPNHVKNLDRWVTKAREANPSLNNEQAERLALMMRKAHYVRMGKLGAQARKLAREAQAELATADETAA